VLRPFVVDRNICNFMWYGGVAGEGLRSVGVSPPRLIQELSALSCPSLDIYGPEHRRTPARRFAPARAPNPTPGHSSLLTA
jgi:hypothetical protein